MTGRQQAIAAGAWWFTIEPDPGGVRLAVAIPGYLTQTTLHPDRQAAAIAAEAIYAAYRADCATTEQETAS
jgi:hypothetical protein